MLLDDVMTTLLTLGRALDTLAAQHADLREIIDCCEEIADEVDAGAADASRLLREVARLRIAFDEHNQFEEQLLRPLLLDVDSRSRAADLAEGARPAPPWAEGVPAGRGAVRVSRMVEDHVEDHRAMRIGLAATPTCDLRGVLASLRDHLATEERQLLSRKVLRDDRVGWTRERVTE